MKDNFCDVTMVLDRSGSMASVRQDTIGGFNTFISEQQALPGECTVSLVQFDDHYEPQFVGRAVKAVVPLTLETFVPRGSTALLDAVGRAVVETGQRLSAMDENARPSRVLFVILTDGGENSSREYTRDAVFRMIGEQKSKYAWDFVFLGANQDAISVGASLNIAAGSAMTYAANALGTQSAFAAVSKYTQMSRAGQASAFSDEDRRKQADAGAK